MYRNWSIELDNVNLMWKVNNFSAFNKHRRPTKSVGYFAQRSRLLFPLNLVMKERFFEIK